MRTHEYQCPLCQAWKVGLDDHLRDKHGHKGPLATPPVSRPRKKLPPSSRPPRHRPRLNEEPLDCPDCGAPMRLKTSHYGLFYGCSEWSVTGCKGAHGAHADGRPKGIPADARTRKMRMAAHNAFDPLWNGPDPKFPSRGAAYVWMRHALGLTNDEAHIAMFDIPKCQALIEAIWAEFDPEGGLPDDLGG